MLVEYALQKRWLLRTFRKLIWLRFRAVVRMATDDNISTSRVKKPLPLEPIKSTDKVGVKYKAVGGQTLINQGEKQVKFKTGSQIASMNLQAINELTQPLASAAITAAKDNTIVLRGGYNIQLYRK